MGRADTYPAGFVEATQPWEIGSQRMIILHADCCTLRPYLVYVVTVPAVEMWVWVRGSRLGRRVYDSAVSGF